MTGTGDPVAQGFVQSLGRPGGNFTGLSLQSTDITGKRLELLKELVPGATPVAVLWGPRVNLLFWQVAEAAARERRWKLLSLEIRDAGDINWRYLKLLLRGERFLGLAPDMFQLGGDFILDRSHNISFLHRMTTNGDRTEVSVLIDELRRVAGNVFKDKPRERGA